LAIEKQRYYEHLERLRYQRYQLRLEQQKLRERRHQYKLASNAASMAKLAAMAKGSVHQHDLVTSPPAPQPKLPSPVFGEWGLLSAAAASSAAPPLSPDTFQCRRRSEHAAAAAHEEEEEEEEPLKLPLALLSRHWYEHLERRLDSDVLELPPSAVISYPRSFTSHIYGGDAFDLD
jgi:hypothetical protein